MAEYIEEKIIREAITEIREKRHHRPDKESIARLVITRHGLAMDAILNTVDKMLDNGNIMNRKTSNDEDSFYITSSDKKETVDQVRIDGSRSKAVSKPTPTNLHVEGSSNVPTPQLTVESSQIGGDIAPTNWANAVTSMMENINLLNRLLQEERAKISNLLEENFSLKILNHDMEMKLRSFVLDNNGNKEKDKIVTMRTKEIRSELINEAERHKQATKGKSSPANCANQAQAKNKSEKQTGNKPTSGSKQMLHQNVEGTDAAREGKPKSQRKRVGEKKLTVLIAGDSQLRRLDASILSNDYRDVDIKCKPGMKIEQTTKEVGKTNQDIIIIHAATNNVAAKTPEQLSKDVINQLKQVQKNNPEARIVFSSVIRRRDDPALNAKVTKLNKLLEDETVLNGFDMIDNSNIMFSNLWTDGLHINDGGVRKLSGNFSKFIKYC